MINKSFECAEICGRTSDLPAPVAPTTAIKGRGGACVILESVLNDLMNRRMYLRDRIKWC